MASPRKKRAIRRLRKLVRGGALEKSKYITSKGVMRPGLSMEALNIAAGQAPTAGANLAIKNRLNQMGAQLAGITGFKRKKPSAKSR